MAEQAGGQPLAPLAGYFTEEAQAQTAGSLKQLVSGVWNQPMIGLHGGLPPAACCPFKGLEVTASDGQCVPLDPAQAGGCCWLLGCARGLGLAAVSSPVGRTSGAR